MGREEVLEKSLYTEQRPPIIALAASGDLSKLGKTGRATAASLVTCQVRLVGWKLALGPWILLNK